MSATSPAAAGTRDLGPPGRVCDPSAATVLDLVREVVEPYGLRLRKALPREPGRLLLELERGDGSTVGGQWFADHQHAHRVFRQTRAASEDDAGVALLPRSGVLLQPHGADRRLPALRRLAAQPDALLLAHRAESRGVVRHRHDGAVVYTKTVRPGRLPDLTAKSRVRVDGVATPRVLTTDHLAASLTCDALPGSTLHALLTDPAVSRHDVVAAGRAVGAAMARLHTTAPPPQARRHDATEEVAVTEDWLRQAGSYGLLDARASPPPTGAVALRGLLAGTPSRPAFLHRDLHDKQVLVDERGGVGILDLDLAAVGEPALDLANLLVHLDLRARQEWCPAGRSAECAQAVVEAYAPDADVWRRVPAYALSARLRLLAVYSFRPHGASAALALLTDPLPGPRSDSEELR